VTKTRMKKMIPVRSWKEVPEHFDTLEEEQEYYQTHEFSEAMKESSFESLRVSENPVRHYMRPSKSTKKIASRKIEQTKQKTF